MKLLFDANLSPALIVHLKLEYPDSAHVRNVSLAAASDVQIWEFARANGFVIVSKDTDFRERSFVEGFPPRVVWLDVGNAGTLEIAALLQKERSRVEHFGTSTETSILVLSLGAKTV